MKIPILRTLVRTGLLFFISLNVFLSSVFLNWQLHRNVDYFYPALYERLEISKHIEQYAPWNQLRKNFHTVGASEHKRVFSEIVHMIHGYGIALDDLAYYGKDGTRIDKVLTKDEVDHLREVASVITFFTFFGLLNLAITIVIVYLSLNGKMRWPTFKNVCIISASGLAICLLILAVIGFDRVFYEFHVWMFSEAPWIFSHNQSLLIILTKSPQLFAVLTFTILVPAFIAYLFFMFCLCHFRTK